MDCYSSACSRTQNHLICDGTVICLIAAHGNSHACACTCHTVDSDQHPGNTAIANVMHFLLGRGYAIIAPNGEPVRKR